MELSLEQKMEQGVLEKSTAPPEVRVRAYLRLLERLHNTLETTTHVMLHDQPERCKAAVGELVKLVVKLSILAESAIRETGDRAAELTKEVGDFIDGLAEQKGQSDGKPAETLQQIEDLVMDALDAAKADIGSLAEDSITLTDAFEDEGYNFETISLMYQPAAGETPASYTDGVDVEWRDGETYSLRLYQRGQAAWVFQFDEDHEGGMFSDPNEDGVIVQQTTNDVAEPESSSSIAPLVGSAALLATAAMMKFAFKKTVPVPAVSIPKPQTFQQEAV